MNITLCSVSEGVLSIAWKNKGHKNITTHKNTFEPNCSSGKPSSIISTWLTFKTFISTTFTYTSITDCHPLFPQCSKISLTLIQASEMIFLYLIADFITSKRRVTQSWPMFSRFSEKLQVAEGKEIILTREEPVRSGFLLPRHVP